MHLARVSSSIKIISIGQSLQRFATLLNKQYKYNYRRLYIVIAIETRKCEMIISIEKRVISNTNDLINNL